MNGAQSMSDTFVLGAQGKAGYRYEEWTLSSHSQVAQAERPRHDAAARVRWCRPRAFVMQDRAIPPGMSFLAEDSYTDGAESSCRTMNQAVQLPKTST